MKETAQPANVQKELRHGLALRSEEVNMYSPKISEELVPFLYRLAKTRRMPMTRLVDAIIRQALASHTLTQGYPTISPETGARASAEPRPAVAA